MDKLFKVEVLRQMQNPQQVIADAMHQDYSEDAVINEIENGSFLPTEKQAGEMVVKRLLAGGRGHYGCYFEDTEVLTVDGFVSWQKITSSDFLAAIDITSGLIKFEQPSKLYVYDIKNEPLYEVKGRYINQLVTSDHRMAISTRTKSGWSDWEFELAKYVAGKAVRHRLNGNICSSVIPCFLDYHSPEAFKLAGFYFGDGITITAKNPSCVRFKLKKQAKIDWLYNLGFTVVKGKDHHYTVFNADLANWLKEFWHDEKGKTIPSSVVRLKHTSFHALMEGLKASDGTNIKPHGFAFDNANKTAINNLQAAAAVHGVHGNITLNNPSKNENHQDCWRIHFNYERQFCRVETQQKGRTEQTTERWINKTGKVYCASVSTGALIVRREGVVSVSGNCLEHPQIVFNVCNFPHSVMQQLRTHRVGVSFDVQSGRYTGKRFLSAHDAIGMLDLGHKPDIEEIERVFYIRPVGFYSDRQGKRYKVTQEDRLEDIEWCWDAICNYKKRINQGWAEEHARSMIPFDFRQHFVMSCNVRSLMHILDLRLKKDAQEECQQCCELMYAHFEKWVPQIAEWYDKNRKSRGMLAP